MDAQLMETFHFDEEDLAANRAGTLSKKQAEKRKKDDVSGNIFIAVLMLGFGIGGILLLLPTIRALALPKTEGGITGFVFGILLVLASLWMLRGLLFSKRDDTVVRVEGKLHAVKSVTESGSPTDSVVDRTNVVHHEMIIGGHNFGVSPDVFNNVLLDRDGDTYAIYITKFPENLLSIEYISPAED